MSICSLSALDLACPSGSRTFASCNYKHDFQRANNTVIPLSETEVGKLFNEDTRSDIGSEAEKMKFANSINGLVVKFIRLDELNADTEMLVMERLYPMDFRAFEVEKREHWLDVFEDELDELHQAGFVHRDLRRPSDMPGLSFDNANLGFNYLST